MRLPGGRIGKALVVVLGKLPDHRPGELSAAHVAERPGIDHVVVMASPQQVEKIQPAL
jgi:hypothetical protein